MTERKTLDLVREGADAFAWYGEGVMKEGPLPCVVRHPDAGGQCERDAVMQVYDLNFCEVHGAEAKAGALEELYHDAADFLGRLDNPHVPEPNRVAVRALREACRGLEAEANRAAEASAAALRRAYPVLPDRVIGDTREFDYEDPNRGPESPVDWHQESRFLLHKLMRLAHEAGELWLVEVLEEYREHESAQLAFALADYEERAGSRAKTR